MAFTGIALDDRFAYDDEYVVGVEAPLHHDMSRSLTLPHHSLRFSLREARKWTPVGIAFGATIALVAVCRSKLHLRNRVADAAADDVTLAAQRCHTAVEGESCYVDVRWAMGDGIWGHPSWYSENCPSLKTSSSFEEFQACVYKINQTTCPLPCNPKDEALREAVAKVVGAEDEDENPQATGAAHKELSPASDRSPCHIAAKGEECYIKVLQAMLYGINDHPDKFPGLTAASSFEEFQMALHQDPDSSCPRPCRCQTAVKGDSCFKHVLWAKRVGIPGHPDWYHGVTPQSDFEDIQRYFQKSGRGSCGLPCTKMHLRSIGGDDLKVTSDEDESLGRVVDDSLSEIEEALDVGEEDDERSEPGGRHKAHNAGDESKQECSTAIRGQRCYDHVLFGMTTGIHKNPEWYPDLTPSSSFEAFQEVLHKNPSLGCPKPCPCENAQEGDTCYDHIKWVLSKGIREHPSYYQDLSARSRFEEVQNRLLEDPDSTCKKPCTPKAWGTPSIFCFSVFRSQGYEAELVRALLQKNVGIFACDEFAVLSDRNLELSKGVRALKIPPCEKVGISKDGTAANTLVFMNAWKVIKDDVHWQAHDWIIKADPDAVLLPDRIRKQLSPHTGKAVYIKNCMKYTGPGWPSMFGSVEAFTNEAIATYFSKAQECKTKLQWQAWGEDLFMGRCLDMLGVGSVFEEHFSGDNVCKGANCRDGVSAAYHPFKSAEKWLECHALATR
mmetsp:Transcript_78522/g.227912  ORF Transcript_78522/g.227912 Transcript_78522/m.227912 type:complete len:725 (+) Transcript_78522:3-2177(+)